MEDKGVKDILQYKNIVFDMGKVLVDYDPDKVTRVYTDNEDYIREIHEVIFASEEWIALDEGSMSEEEALVRWLPRLSSEDVRWLGRLAFRDWNLYNMWTKEGTPELIERIKDRGQKVYILSNASLRLPDCYRQVMPRAELYDGVFFSAAHHCRKPQDRIYQSFFGEFGLKPEDCFFIDDLQENIEGAKRNGMNGFVFSDGRIETLKKLLRVE